MSTATTDAAVASQRGALERLALAHGPLERRTALLALLVSPFNEPQQHAWERACVGVALAERIGVDVALLAPATRLPVFEALLDRSRPAPLAEKRDLLEHARRVLAAAGGVRPLDRLRWLVMRHRLGEAPLSAPDAGSELSASAVPALSVFAAFLARIVPLAQADGGIGAEGWAWHERMLAPWATQDANEARRRGVPHAEDLLPALRMLQAQSWMLRPVLLRALVDALEPPGAEGLDAQACDALRLVATLLDAPLPPTLAERYVETGWTHDAVS